MVTVCGTFQLSGVNVSDGHADGALGGVAAADRDDDVGRRLARQHDRERRRAAASVVVRPFVGVTVTPAVSLSAFVTATSATSSAVRASYAESVLVGSPVTTE